MMTSLISGMIGAVVAISLAALFKVSRASSGGDESSLMVDGYIREGKDWRPVIRFRDRRYVIRDTEAIEETAHRLKLAEISEARLVFERNNWKRLAELRSDSLHRAIEDRNYVILDHVEALR